MLRLDPKADPSRCLLSLLGTGRQFDLEPSSPRSRQNLADSGLLDPQSRSSSTADPSAPGVGPGLCQSQCRVPSPGRKKNPVGAELRGTTAPRRPPGVAWPLVPERIWDFLRSGPRSHPPWSFANQPSTPSAAAHFIPNIAASPPPSWDLRLSIRLRILLKRIVSKIRNG